MKRNLLFITTAVLAASCFGVNSFGADFSDINAVPWEGAKPYINSVADLGLMIGDIDPKSGKKIFRANDRVTYCETTQLAYSILKNAAKLKPSSTDLSTKWAHVLKSYNIPQWAYECIAYALENEALTLTDVSRFMTKSGNTISSNNASRESVAVIFGKMFQDYYPASANPKLTFLDSKSIAPSSIPYVDLLSNLGIMIGDTDNNFTPKAYINRAEMAVLTSKAHAIITGNQTAPSNPNTTPIAKGVLSGTIASLEDYGGNKLLSVKSESGAVQGFMINSATYIVKGDSSQQISLGILRVGDKISVDFEGTKVNVVRYLNENIATSTEEKGLVDEITNSKIYLINSSDKVISYYLNDNCTWTLDGKSSTMKKVFDKFEDNSLTAVITIDRDGKVTDIKITAEEAVGITGTLVSINNDELNYREGSSSKIISKPWTSKMEIELEGKPSTIRKVEDASLKSTLYVKIYMDTRDHIRKVLISADKFSTTDGKNSISGTLYSIDDDKAKIKRFTNDNKDSYYYDEEIKYYLDGDTTTYKKILGAYNAAEDAGKDFYVRFELNTKDKIIKLYASKDKSNIDGASYKKTIDCELIFITTTDLRYDDDVEKKTLDLASDASLYLDGKTATAKEIEAARKSEGVLYATLYINNDNTVVKIDSSIKRTSASKDHKGSIKSMDKNTIQLSGGKSLDLDSNVEISWDDEKVSVSSFVKAVDDRDVTIKAELKVKNDSVTNIEAYTEKIEGDLSELNSRDRTMEIETRDKIYKLRLKSGAVDCSGTFNSIRELDTGLNYDANDFSVTATLEEGRVIAVYAKKQ